MMKRNLLMLGAALTLGGLSEASAGRLSPTLLQRAQKGDQSQVGVIVRFQLPNDAQGRAQLKNLRENVLPTRARASLVLSKDETHAIESVALRKL